MLINLSTTSIKKKILLIGLLFVAFLFSFHPQPKEKETPPEEITEKFMVFLAEGKCPDATNLTIEPARTKVNITDTNLCMPYKSEIIEVNCKQKNDSVYCDCHELREGAANEQFNHIWHEVSLVLNEGEWKVCDFRFLKFGVE